MSLSVGFVARGLLAGAALLVSADVWAAAGEGRGRADAGAPVPVRAAVAEKKPMPVEIDTFGAAEANATVTVKPQVTGAITAVHFKDGQAVKKGDKLFSIDERLFKAEVDRTRAQLKNAQSEYDRQKDLFKAGGTTESAYQQAEAGLAVAKAAVEVAALNFEYCTITSPIDGRAGACLVDAGNMVKSGDAALVVINQIQPIQVGFAVPQQSLAEVKARMAAGKLEVKAFIAGQAEAETGELVFVDNAVDRATGTVRLKASFENRGERLWPGQFVTVKVVLKVEPDAVVVPSKALQNGQRGLYLFVIKGQGTEEDPLVADKREPVIVDREIGEESVITSGNVQPGERVVTDGQLRIIPKPKDAPASTPGDAPKKPSWSTLVIDAGQDGKAGGKAGGQGAKDKGTGKDPRPSDKKAGGAPRA